MYLHKSFEISLEKYEGPEALLIIMRDFNSVHIKYTTLLKTISFSLVLLLWARNNGKFFVSIQTCTDSALLNNFPLNALYAKSLKAAEQVC